MIKRINDNYYKVYCPICDYWFDGSEYLMTIFENNDYMLWFANWYDVMKGNTTAADAILDRLVHTSVRFELQGSSLRQKRHQNCNVTDENQ